MGVRQAVELSVLLREASIPPPGRFEVPPEGPLPRMELVGGMRATLLSPRSADLRAWETAYDEQRSRLGPDPERGAKSESSSRLPSLPTVFVSYSREDQDSLERLRDALRPYEGTDLSVWSDDTDLIPGTDWRAEIDGAIDAAAVGVVLVSPSYLASEYAMEAELPRVLERAADGDVRLTWFALRSARWEQTPLVDYQPAVPPTAPLLDLPPDEQDVVLADIARQIADAARGGTRTPERSATPAEPPDGRPDVETLAKTPFVDDTAPAHRASLAFLLEHDDRAILIGGDACAGPLEESIDRLLRERGEARLRLDAFVIPHQGSRRNLSPELLELLACDQFLVSGDGAYFKHPDPATIARIIMFGRATSRAVPTIVFNHRSPYTEMWADPDLREEYGFRAVFPEVGGEGIRVELP